MPPFTICLKQHQFALIVLFFILLSRATTIVQWIFITEIFKPQLFSSYAMCLYIGLTEFFRNHRYLVCLLYGTVRSLMNALAVECLCLHEISIHVNKLLVVLLLFLYCNLLLLDYFLIPFFILMLLPYFCLSVDHVNKSIVLLFELLKIKKWTLRII